MSGPKPPDSGSPPAGALEDTARRAETGVPASTPAAQAAVPPVLPDEPKTDSAPAPGAPAAPPKPSTGNTGPRPSLRPVGPGPLPRFPTDPGGVPVARGKEAKPPEEKVFTRAPTSWTPEKTAKGQELPTGKAAVGEFPTGESQPTGAQVPWTDGDVRPAAETGLEDLDTAAMRPVPEPDVAELNTSVMPKRPEPEVGLEELPTSAIKARKDTPAEVDEAEDTNTTTPIQKRAPKHPAMDDGTVRMPAVRSTTGPRPTLSANDEEDAEKKRDRMTALMVLGIGIPLIVLVYLATRYEPKPPPERPHIVQAPSFAQSSGGGKRGGGGSGGGKKGGNDLPPEKRPILALGNDCVSKCAEKQLSCSASCKAGEKCREHCLDKARGCENSCTGDKATIGDEMLDCLTETGEPRKCTDKDIRQEQAQSKAVRSLCRNNEGEPIPCPDQLAKIEKGKQLMEKQCGADGSKCAEEPQK